MQPLQKTAQLLTQNPKPLNEGLVKVRCAGEHLKGLAVSLLLCVGPIRTLHAFKVLKWVKGLAFRV